MFFEEQLVERLASDLAHFWGDFAMMRTQNGSHDLEQLLISTCLETLFRNFSFKKERNYEITEVEY